MFFKLKRFGPAVKNDVCEFFRQGAAPIADIRIPGTSPSGKTPRTMMPLAVTSLKRSRDGIGWLDGRQIVANRQQGQSSIPPKRQQILHKTAVTLLHLGPGLANGLANLRNVRRARQPAARPRKPMAPADGVHARECNHRERSGHHRLGLERGACLQRSTAHRAWPHGGRHRPGGPTHGAGRCPRMPGPARHRLPGRRKRPLHRAGTRGATCRLDWGGLE